MISEKLIDKIIFSATREDLEMFVKEVFNHIRILRSWDDRLIVNALELVGGASNPYEIKHIKDKLDEYIKKKCKAENVTNINIIYIDNITLNVYVSYEVGNQTYTTYVDIKEVSDVE